MGVGRAGRVVLVGGALVAAAGKGCGAAGRPLGRASRGWWGTDADKWDPSTCGGGCGRGRGGWVGVNQEIALRVSADGELCHLVAVL